MAPENSDDDNKNRFQFKSYTPANRTQYLSYFLRAVIALVVLILLILIGRQIHHLYVEHHPTSNSGSHVATTSGSSSQASHRNSSATNSKKASSAPGHKSSSQSLPNNGPGNVVAIFASVTLAGALLHHLASSRRQAE